MSKTVLITGGCGFIGHHVVEHIHRKTNWRIVIIDKLSYATKGFERLRSANLLDSNRIRVFTFDLINPLSDGLQLEIGEVHYIIHMAADTHVDNSISDPVPFIHNNVMSTVHLLEYAKTLPDLEKFFYFSTDEVFGSAPEGVAYKEWDRHRPTNPYSASKSACESLCIAYENTYNVPIILTNVMNAFGERQHVEKFIPKVIEYVLSGKTIEIHSDSSCENPGSRFYIHCRNIASAVLFLIKNGEKGESYHIVGEKEVDNLSMAQLIADIVGKELKYKLVNFHQDRPGHDLRYALDGSKLLNMGWELPMDFEQSLRKTVLWTLEHQEWLDW
jgi:dTDP-glucose 4,6-dehydratase